ncbi:hypothetical protein LTR86_009675 [Recurvomyces mirabilis]|nr:hypothetical protein LTR86_009675 [Recurvomyces mirabilis]
MADKVLDQLSDMLRHDIEFAKDSARTSGGSCQDPPLDSPITRGEDVGYPASTSPSLPLRVAHDAGWLRVLVSHPNGIAIDDIASQTSSEPGLVQRLLRLLAAGGSVDEAGRGAYKPNDLTRVLQTEGLAAGLRHASDEYTHTLSKMPEYFRQNGYKQPTADVQSIYHFTHGVSAFEQFVRSPDRAEAFNTFMGYARIGKKNWFDVYPIPQLQVKNTEDVLMVDIGGNRGHDLVAFAKKLNQSGRENYVGKLINQDLEKVLNEAPAEWQTVFTKQPHDFFTPQPPSCRGARVYNMKTVLHDWPDSDCVKILSHVKDAMTLGYSTLLINEVVLPDTECGWLAAGMDITMLACLSGKERSETEWRRLVGQVEGLRVVKV